MLLYESICVIRTNPGKTLLPGTCIGTVALLYRGENCKQLPTYIIYVYVCYARVMFRYASILYGTWAEKVAWSTRFSIELRKEHWSLPSNFLLDSTRRKVDSNVQASGATFHFKQTRLRAFSSKPSASSKPCCKRFQVMELTRKTCQVSAKLHECYYCNNINTSGTSYYKVHKSIWLFIFASWVELSVFLIRDGCTIYISKYVLIVLRKAVLRKAQSSSLPSIHWNQS